jgi:hypothetical protein
VQRVGARERDERRDHCGEQERADDEGADAVEGQDAGWAGWVGREATASAQRRSGSALVEMGLPRR